MDLQQLRCFVAVAQLGSVQAAGESLCLCRQAVSKTLGQLELQLGVTLFERSANGIRLAPRGERFVPKAESLLQAFHELEVDMKGQETPCQIRVCFPFTTQHYFGRVLRTFAQNNSDWIQIETVNALDRQCHDLLRLGDIDLGVSILPFEDAYDESKWLTSSRMLVAVSRDSPLAKREVLSSSDLAEHPLVFYMNGYTQLDWLEPDSPRPAFQVNDILQAYDLVLGEQALFPVPELAVLGPMTGIVWKPYEGRNGRDDFYCALSRNAGKDRLRRRACLAVREALAKSNSALRPCL